MSSRRGGAGGRKGKNNKPNSKQGGKGGDASSELPLDKYHNLHLPCSRFLEDTCKEVWTIDEEESSLLMASSSPISSASSSHERPDKRLGRMLRHHLLEKRRQEAANAAGDASNTNNNPSGDASATTPPSKKKKKKKKKKANKQGGDADGSAAADADADGATANETEAADAPAPSGTATETDATVPISVSRQNHHQEDSSISGDMMMAVSAKEESLRTSACSAATTATMTTSTSTTSSIANSSPDNHHNHNPTATANDNSAAWTTPVDAYLDRLLVQQDEVQKRLENEQSIIANSSSSSNDAQNNTQTKTAIPRDLESFVKFLNTKHGSNNNNINKGPLVITQQEVEAVFKKIKCEPCQQKMLDLFSQGNIQRQPVVLGGISFGDGNDNSNNNKAFQRNHANGLAIPVDHPALGIREDPSPSVDFDYVALEEGGNPVGAWMEAKADLQGVPYFHPQLSSDAAPSSGDPAGSSNHSSNYNHHHKNTHSKGSNNNNNNTSLATSSKSKQQQHAAQIEWRFVSSSATQNQTLNDDSNISTTQTTKPDTATNKPEKKSSLSSSPSTIITVQDLEHILKNVMLPLSMPFDELLGACADLTEDELAEIHERVKKLDMNINRDIHAAKAYIEQGIAELREADLASTEGNLEFKAGPIYIQRNSEFHAHLNHIICEIAWGRTLWLGDGNTRVIRTTESWWKTVKHLTDIMLSAISETMKAVEEYETALQEEVADNSGKIPDLFLSKSHRVVYSKMLARRVAILNDLLAKVNSANCQMEEVWPMLSSGANSAFSRSGEGLKVFFRRKWFAQQELCRTIASRQSQEEGTKKGLTNNAKTKRDALQRHKVASSSTTAPTAAMGPEKWVQTLDINGGDLLSALVDLSKCENLPRLSEMKEEQIVRCQKVLGRLGRVAREIFAPLADTERAKNNPTSFALQDEKLKSQCQSLSAQIQKEEELQQQQQLLAAPGEEEPSVTEQKRAVARLTMNSIKLLLHLRKCVSDSHEPQNRPPTLPIGVVSWLCVGARFQPVDMRNCSYSALVHAMLLLLDQFSQYPSPRGEEPVIPCRGEGSVMPRLASVLLALFYGKLSEQCSEWHAEMNEQELLTNMTESDAGLQTGNISGQQSSTSKRDSAVGRNGTTANSDNQGKASKKTKKKQKKSASTTQSSTADGTPGSGQEVASGPQKTPDISSSPSSNEIQEGTPDGTATAMNGHQEPSAATTKECLVAEEPAGKTTKTKGNKMKENKINSKEPLDDTDKTEAQSPEKGDKEEISTVEVDRDMGVKDHLGVFDSAENFLVKRLTALFEEAAQDSSSVVII